MKEAIFEGHNTPNDGVAIDPSKVFVVMEWTQPMNVTEVRSNLGL